MFIFLAAASTSAGELPDGWEASKLASVEHVEDQTFKVVGAPKELGLLIKSVPGQGNIELSGTVQLGPEDGGRAAFLVAGNPETGWIVAGLFTGSKKLTIQQYDPEWKPLDKAWRTVEIEKDGTFNIDLMIDMEKKGITMNVEGQEPNFAGLKLPRFGITRVGFGVQGETPATFSGLELKSGNVGKAAPKSTVKKPPAGPINIQEEYTQQQTTEFKTGLNAISPLNVSFTDEALVIGVQGVGWLDRKLLALQADQVYVLEMEARGVGQVERLMPIIRGTPLDDFWPVSQEWQTYRTQFRMSKGTGPRTLQLRMRGVGDLQVRRFSFKAVDDFDIPDPPAADRGELVRNADFSLKGDGWYRGHPGSYKLSTNPDLLGDWQWDPKLSKFYLDLPDAPELNDRPVVSQHRFTMHHGKTYTLRVSGEGGPFQVQLRYPVYGAQAPLTYKDWRGSFDGGEWTQTFTLEPPEDGMLATGVEFFIQIGLKSAATRLDRVSLIEGEAKPQPSTAIELVGMDDPYGSNLTVGQAVDFIVHTDGLAEDGSGDLVVTDHRGQVLSRTPVSLSQSDGGQVRAQGTLPGLPTGWFTLSYVPAEGPAKAWPREVAVLPHPLAVADTNGFLGTHFRGLYIDREKPLFYQRERINQIQGWGVSHQRLFTDWSRLNPLDLGGEHTGGAEIDKQVDAGLVMLIQLAGWEGLDKSLSQEEREAKWADLVRQTAEQWKGKVNAYEVWNEPDLERLPPEEHVRACEIAYQQIKAVDPDALVVAGAVTTSGRRYLEQCIELGMLEHCDMVSFRGYVREQAADAGPDSFREFTEPIIVLMKQHGKVRPIWDTESGWGIPTGLDGLTDARTFVKAFTTRQAAGVSRYYSYMAAPKGFPGASHFTLFTGFNERPLLS